MRSQVALEPGQKGIKKLLDQYSSRLICVRYRDDEQHHRQIKIVELIIGLPPWHPKSSALPDDALVSIRIGLKEVDPPCQWVRGASRHGLPGGDRPPVRPGPGRSEERRVGKECRSRWSPY